MVGCSRGILIGGLTNCARTQMAEGILRCLTADTVFIKSGGVHHETTIHPLAVKVMRDIGVDISGQFVSSLESARRQHDTYDVYISIDCGHDRRTTYKALQPAGGIQRSVAHVLGADTEVTKKSYELCSCDDSSHCCYNKDHGVRFAEEKKKVETEEEDGEEEGDVCYDPLLVPETPAHWSVAADATDARRRWQIWSPRDPTIFHETSTRKFQDHLYEGEPLFMQLRTTVMRTRMKVSEQWQMDEVAVRYALEPSSKHEKRFVIARDELLRRSVALLERLEKHYGEHLLLDDRLLRNKFFVL